MPDLQIEKKIKSMLSYRNMHIKLMCSKTHFAHKRIGSTFVQRSYSWTNIHWASTTGCIKIIPGLRLHDALQLWKLCLYLLFNFTLATNLSIEIYFLLEKMSPKHLNRSSTWTGKKWHPHIMDVGLWCHYLPV